MKSEFDDMKGRTLEDISRMVQQLTKRINSKKDALAPLIRELKPLRQQVQVWLKSELNANGVLLL